MNTEIENAEIAASDEAQYDLQAKRLLSNKEILGHILIRTVDDFKDMTAAEAAKYIEGEVQLNRIPVEPGLTNDKAESGAADGSRVVGMNTENGEINEGTIRYDLIFYVRTPEGYGRKGRLAKIIVNVEMQKSSPSKYYLINRSIFYVSRMISSQKERDFVNDDYDGLQRVYSIWIVMGMDECSLDHIHLTDDHLLGKQEWKGGLDLLNIVMIGLPDELTDEKSHEYELHRLLGALFSQDLSYDDKMKILKDEYHVEEDASFRKEMEDMSNLGEGLVEKTAEREQRKYVLNMHKKGLPLEQIAEVAEISEAEVQAIIDKDMLVMA